MRRIATPEYAPAIEIDVNPAFGEEEYRRVMEQRDWILHTFDMAVQTYIDEYAYAEPEEFPSLTRLNGEYYIGREGYWVIDEEWRVKEHRFSIMAHCLEHRHLIEDQDYLGLEVHFTWLPESGEILYQGDVDSSSI
jgi:hypothetical protein